MKELVIDEKYSKYWPLIAVSSAPGAVLLYISSIFSENILLEGYLALTAFCLFALSVFSFFKLRDGQVRIMIELDPERILTVGYTVRGKKLPSEQFDLDEFEEVKSGEMPDRSIHNNFSTGDRTILFRRRNGGNWFYILQVQGRVIPLDKINAEKLLKFIRYHMSEEAIQ